MSDGRPGETEEQQADRRFSELLQELRVSQTGVQILFAFLLTIPFQARFAELDAFERDTLVVALLLSAMASGCLIAPVAYHRVLFQLQMKDDIVTAANRYARAGLAFLLLAICTSVQLVLDLVLGRRAGLLIAGALGLVLITMWGIAPLWRRAHRR